MSGASATRPKRPRRSSPSWSIPSCPPSSPEIDLSPLPVTAPFDLSTSACHPLSAPSCKPGLNGALPTSVWLQAMRLNRYAPNFRAHNTVSDLATALYPDQNFSQSALTYAENVLRERYAVSALGARKKISSAIQQWAPRPNVPSSAAALVQEGKQENQLISRSKTASSPASSEPTNEVEKGQKKRSLWPIFTPGYIPHGDRPGAKRAKARGEMLTTSTSGQRVFRTLSSTTNIFDVANQTTATKIRGGGRGGGGGMGGGSKFHRTCHRVPGTSFTVDSFRVRKEVDDCTVHFLSHMHADHYGGLTKTSLQPGAKVLCSAVTAALARVILGLPEELLQQLPLSKPIEVTCPRDSSRSATVWLYDANHCPGAVLLLFRICATGEYILHCGDCRFDRGLFEQHAELRRVVEAGGLDTLYLDTTYAAPEHTFPAQSAVLDEVARAAGYEDRRTRGRCIFFVGAYTIGKEKVFLAIAEAIDSRIFADARKRRILRALGFGARLEKRIADRANDARVHVVPMRALGADGLRDYARKSGLDTGFIGRGLAVVVKPTGWTFKADERAFVRRRSRAVDQAVAYDVPYSEHSSFRELKELVTWAKPRKIVPTVGFSTPEKAKELAKMLGHQTPRR